MPRYHTRRHKAKGRRSKLTRSRRVRRQRGGNPKPKIQAQYIEFGQLKGEIPLKKEKLTDLSDISSEDVHFTTILESIIDSDEPMVREIYNEVVLGIITL